MLILGQTLPFLDILLRQSIIMLKQGKFNSSLLDSDAGL